MPDGYDICAAFGRRVRLLRQSQGMSQEDFAAQAGLDRTYVSGVERGVRNISLRNIGVIAKALGMTVSKLTEGIESSSD